ncbi:hypothetical protein [Vibrio coralliilyticus]|uniref:hypothetical protein n=1 Tax=Vibrio coralliilyticus TaxID=190893 RepID=UPI00156027A5|nr:hypothetical protein [Vibrio coralliilyticus]NRF13639.1 hypothetical protein [Vibrio coralliilyticus]
MAIDDYLAEGRDVSAYFVGVASPYRLFEEQYTNQWALMQTAMQLCMFGSKGDLKMPSIVKRRGQELEFYKDLSSYYSSRNIIDIAKKNEAYPGQFNEVNSELNKLYGSNMSSAMESKEAYFEEKYNASPAKLKSYDTWAATDKWRKMLDWQRMFSEMEELTKKREELFEPVVKVKEDFRKFLDKFSPHLIEWCFDLWDDSTQEELHLAHLDYASSFVFVVTEKCKDWLSPQVTKPTSILLLNNVGFSRQIFSELYTYIPQEKTESDNKDLLDKVTELNSSFSLSWGVYSSIMNFVSSEDIQKSLIFGEIAKKVGSLDAVLIANASALKTLALRYGVSTVAQSGVGLMSMIASESKLNVYRWQLIWAERLALGMGLKIPTNFLASRLDWESSVKTEQKAIGHQQSIIDSYKHSTGVSYSQKLEARNRLKNLKALQKRRLLDVPQLIKQPSEVVKALSSTYEDILEKKFQNLNRRFEDVGGMGFIAMLFSAVASIDAINDVHQKGYVSEEDLLDIGQSIVGIGVAWSGITTSKLWSAIKSENYLGKYSRNGLFNSVSKGKMPSVSMNQIKRVDMFTQSMRLTGALGVVHSFIGLRKTWVKLDKSSNDLEKSLLIGKLATDSMTLGVFLIQTIGARVLPVALLSGAFILGALMVVSVVSVLLDLSLSYTKRDDYQKWLAQLPWGIDGTRSNWSNKEDMFERVEENRSIVRHKIALLNQIFLKPVVSHKPIEKIEAFPRYTHKTIIGLELKIEVPNTIGGESIVIQTNTSASSDELSSGVWKSVETKSELETSSSAISYVVNLPIEADSKYLSLKVAYPTQGEDNSEIEYYFKHKVSEEAQYNSLPKEHIGEVGSLNQQALIEVREL